MSMRDDLLAPWSKKEDWADRADRLALSRHLKEVGVESVMLPMDRGTLSPADFGLVVEQALVDDFHCLARYFLNSAYDDEKTKRPKTLTFDLETAEFTLEFSQEERE